MLEKFKGLSDVEDLTTKIGNLKADFKDARGVDLRALREEYVQLVKQHPDYLTREIKASIVGGKTIEDFSPEEIRAIEITAQALAQANISLYTGGYTGVMDVSSKLHKENKNSEIGVLAKTFAVTIKDIAQNKKTKYGINSPKSATERLRTLAKQADIVFAMKGSEGTMREVMETMYEDWPDDNHRRFIVAFGEENALNIIRAMKYKNENGKNDRLRDVFYFDFDSFKGDNDETTSGDMEKIFEYVISQITSTIEAEQEGDSDSDDRIESLRFVNRIDKKRLIELAKKEIEAF